MRFVWALAVAVGSLLPIGATTFATEPGASDAGVEAATSADGPVAPTDAPVDPAAPCPDAACGTVVARSQQNVSEIDVDRGLVAWTTTEPNGFLRTAPRDGKTLPRDLAGPDARPHSLQFFGTDLLYVATGIAIHAVDRSTGGVTQGLPAGGANEVLSQRRVGSVLVFTRDSTVEQCDIIADQGCPAVGNMPVALDGPGLDLRPNPGGSVVWLRTPGRLSAVKISSFSVTQSWDVAGVTALAVDAAQVYFVKEGSNVIYANDADAQTAAAATALVTASPPTALSLGADFVYYSVADEGIVAKVRKTGGAQIVIASRLPHPTAIASQDKALFVVLGDGRIVSVPTE